MSDNDSPLGRGYGTWTIRLNGGDAFWANAVNALNICAAEKRPGGIRECLERLAAADAQHREAPPLRDEHR